MKMFVFDFEVFKYDTLLGVKFLDDGETKYFQTWDKDEIKQFYEANVKSLWIGHNNSGYDNLILQAVVKGRDPYELSKALIGGDRRHYLRMPLIWYDLTTERLYSLKHMEAYDGEDISETEVDFNLDRPLTDEEKLKTEAYNRDDLDQTHRDLNYSWNDFSLRLAVMKEFNLSYKALTYTGTRLAEEVLHAEKIDGIENWVVKPTIYPQLQVKNQAVLDYYLQDRFRTSEKLIVNLCGVDHKLGAGGIHAAQKQKYFKEALYFDVSGYYNLVMINYNLLPRSIPDEYKKLYEFMYHEQLRLKKIDPGKRGVYKTILLSVFGAMMNEHCRFYDPYNGLLVTITGQLFLVDLLEKLEGKVEVIQSNTDGVIARLINGSSEDEVIAIINEWQARTGFVLKLEKIYDVFQRDVNCYLYRDAGGEIHPVGEAVKDYGKWEWPFWKKSLNSKEAFIIPVSIVEFIMNGVPVEETVEKNKRSLRMFQQIARKMSYDWLEYEEIDKDGNKTVETVQHVNRVFARKDKSTSGMIYKRKASGKTTKAKVSNLPDSIFIYNDEVKSDEAIDKVSNMIDYGYYVDRAYERIDKFLGGEDDDV